MRKIPTIGLASSLNTACRRTLFLVALIVTMSGLGCQSSPGPSGGGGPSGDLYYARFAIQVDRGFVRSTNYRGSGGGVTIPINTKVEFESKRRNRSTMRLADGRTFVFEHVAKHTMDTSEEAFDSFFSAHPIDLSSFSSKEKKAIEAGMIEVGMSRNAVLASAGPPPAVGTLSREGPIWKYWTNRFSTFLVRFDTNGKVSAIGR
jgi:hypothetical protein